MEERIDMLVHSRQDLFEVGRTGDLLFYVFKRQELVADQFSKFFTKLLLSFRKNSLYGHTQDAKWVPWMEKHLDSNPVGEIANESGDKRDQDIARVHMMELGMQRYAGYGERREDGKGIISKVQFDFGERLAIIYFCLPKSWRV
jgi:hypothetical protein